MLIELIEDGMLEFAEWSAAADRKLNDGTTMDAQVYHNPSSYDRNFLHLCRLR